MTTLKHARPLVIAAILACALAGGIVGLALAGEGELPAGPGIAHPVVQTQERADCAECHPDITASWQGGPHDMAYDDPLFQERWQQVDNDPACLECHTTNYSPATGSYLAEGVTCEACHGLAPAEHPPEHVDINRANEVCKDCHTVTHAEFRASRHQAEGMNCVSCHYAHTNGLRAPKQLDQCLTCHSDNLSGFVAHVAHIEDAGLACRHCHGYVEPGIEIPIDGLAPTGHDFQPSLRSCLDCHESLDLVIVNGEGTGQERPVTNFDLGGREAALRAKQLEAALQTVLLQNRNRAVLTAIEGGVAGLVLGSVVTWFVSRGLPRFINKRKSDKESGSSGADKSHGR